MHPATASDLTTFISGWTWWHAIVEHGHANATLALLIGGARALQPRQMNADFDDNSESDSESSEFTLNGEWVLQCAYWFMQPQACLHRWTCAQHQLNFLLGYNAVGWGNIESYLEFVFEAKKAKVHL